MHKLLLPRRLLIGMPLFVLFGWLSDKIGRKKIIMAGLLLACLTYRIPGTDFWHLSRDAARGRQ